MTDIYIPRPLKVWASEKLGDFEIISTYRDPDKENGVWKIDSGSDLFFLKMHQMKSDWHQEVNTYSNWAMDLKPYVPTLEGVYEGQGLQGILLSAQSGIPLKEADHLSKNNLYLIFGIAGQLARQVHSQHRGDWFGRCTSNGQPLEENFNDPIEYFKSEFLKPFNLALRQNSLTRDEIKMANWVHDNIHSLADQVPVPVNRNYSPRDWLVDEEGRLSGVIDFEKTYWGLSLDTFGTLWDQYFPLYDGAEEAFFAGYGYNPLDTKPTQTRVIMIKVAIENICYGTSQGREEYIQRGKRLLVRVEETF